MNKTEKVELTNMCMIYNQQGQILVQDRKNPNWPGITFPGGHIEKEESFVTSIKREVKEETGLIIHHPQICGLKQFQTKENTRYIVFFFKTNHFEGRIKSSLEGEVFWMNRDEITNHKLADGFLEMLKVFEEDSLNEIYYQKTVDDNWIQKLF